ncbi:peptide chain release factor N(5)-glutamine methyltransferase [bacterium]|jgi:release factor glutamine methyltransferase|nr:peptide chain release factor N(5)-glutamine methyltransferase [bacterium]MBT4334965.1 peptide chain release factor N(5)-glutamine methyltransferase [bacterium]MBT4495660.1 peptide chain release factor N(5)-glutamine methyltransferase [bacterium]MBT4764322.1 peptide chain release factor N(5)-glutamine methyltransferase [bacterium]MBT5401693.1 peptide chain release factor N(5)-glutamine methyltransferase [bacterium]
MNIKEVLEYGEDKLKHIDSATLDAELLLSYTINKEKEYIYTYPYKEISKKNLNKYIKLLKKRAKYIPLAYLLEYKEFYGLKFKVNKHVLVPRPLTEALVDKAYEVIKDSNIKNIVEIGTGSGAIIIALVHKLGKESKNFNFYATDISNKALKVAKYNAKENKVKKYITFKKGNLLKPVKHIKIDLLLTNLPYLNKDDMKELSISKEPKTALLEKDHYKKFFKQTKKYLTKVPIIIFEDKKGITTQNL